MNALAAALPPAVARAIRGEAFRASRRLRRYGYDACDLQQEFFLHWGRHRHQHDAGRSLPETFATHVCRHRTMTMLEAATAEKRGGGKVYSVSELPIIDDHGKEIERPETVSQDTSDLRFGRQTRPAAELAELKLDVDRVVASLPSHLASFASRLATESVASAAQSTGVSRATGYRHVGELRAAFAEAGLDRYLTRGLRPRCEHGAAAGAEGRTN